MPADEMILSPRAFFFFGRNVSYLHRVLENTLQDDVEVVAVVLRLSDNLSSCTEKERRPRSTAGKETNI